MTSTSFIRTEINALEALGAEIHRFAVRPWDGPLVDPADKLEASKTFYLFQGKLLQLLANALIELINHPVRLFLVALDVVKLTHQSGYRIARNGAYFLQAISLKKQLKQRNLSHVHCHFSTNACTVAYIASLLGGSTFSFTVHGPDELDDADRLSLTAKVINARFVVAISDFCKSQIVRLTGFETWEKIHVVRCGIDFSLFKPMHTKAKASKVLLSIGRLTRQKGQLLFPVLASLLVSKYPSLEIRVIGDGEERPFLEAEIARLNVGNCVKLLGWRNQESVRDELSNCDIFLLPSFAEGLPIVLMEAMAMGKPVLTTSIAGIPELVDKRVGRVVPAGSIEALAVAAREMLELSDESIATMATDALQRVRALHNIDASSRALFELLKRTLEDPTTSIS